MSSQRIYDKFKYIFPPRPETVAPPEHLSKVEGTHWGQPKLNGSCAILATNGKDFHFMTRHKDEFKNKLLIKPEELKSLHRGTGWIYLVGEYLNKSQKDFNRKTFNGKFVIFDILVYDSKWMVGVTFQERQELLEKLYETSHFDGWIRQATPNCFIVDNIRDNFQENWNTIIAAEMYEGMVFKRPDAPLQVSFSERNNTGWQLKIRKPTKNYSY